MEAKKVTVSEIDLGKQWPLIVNSGEILNRDLAIIFRDQNGNEYALNGIAEMRKDRKNKLKYLNKKLIWKSDPQNKDYKVPITPLIKIGLAL